MSAVEQHYVTPLSALSFALIGDRPYDQAVRVLKILEDIGWTVRRKSLIFLDLGKFAYDDMPTILRDTAERHRDDNVGMGGFNVTSPAFLDFIADQIEAQTKPARIPEPGLWGVVEARMTDLTTREFVRVSRHRNSLDWKPVYATPDEYGGSVNWDDLIDPTLIREGLS